MNTHKYNEILQCLPLNGMDFNLKNTFYKWNIEEEYSGAFFSPKGNIGKQIKAASSTNFPLNIARKGDGTRKWVVKSRILSFAIWSFAECKWNAENNHWPKTKPKELCSALTFICIGRQENAWQWHLFTWEHRTDAALLKCANTKQLTMNAHLCANFIKAQ